MPAQHELDHLDGVLCADLQLPAAATVAAVAPNGDEPSAAPADDDDGADGLVSRELFERDPAAFRARVDYCIADLPPRPELMRVLLDEDGE